MSGADDEEAMRPTRATSRARPSPEAMRSARAAHGLSQRDLAATLGVTQQALSAWERGASAPRGRHRRALEAFIESAPGAPEPLIPLRDALPPALRLHCGVAVPIGETVLCVLAYATPTVKAALVDLRNAPIEGSAALVRERLLDLSSTRALLRDEASYVAFALTGGSPALALALQPVQVEAAVHGLKLLAADDPRSVAGLLACMEHTPPPRH